MALGFILAMSQQTQISRGGKSQEDEQKEPSVQFCSLITIYYEYFGINMVSLDEQTLPEQLQ